jgi:hypothetical protein
MALKTKNGTVAGPITLICATVCFLGVLGLFAFLFVIVPDRADIYVRVLIPSLTSIGAAAVVWLKTHAAQINATAENEQIYAKANEAVKTVDKRLNGELDARIEGAITKALVTVQQSPVKEES